MKALRYFIDYLQLPPDAYDRLLPPEKDPKLIQMDICDFITHLRNSGRSSASISTYIAAIHKFYLMNDVTILNWNKIHSFEGEKEKQTEDRPYTHSEIHTLITNASLRNRSIILLMCSAGLRVGAIPLLRIKDLEPIDKYNIYKITVYAKSIRSRYFSFCTPEARQALDNYFDYRKRWGERLEDETPVFRTDYNAQRPQATPANNISVIRMQGFVRKIALDCGIRSVPVEGKVKRSHIMSNHGFRKFFETNAFKAGMDHIYIRRLMGQKSGLEDAYLKLSEEELLEGDSKHVGYIGIIDQLTIDDTHRLKREVQTLRIEKSKMERLEEEVAKLSAVFDKFVT